MEAPLRSQQEPRGSLPQHHTRSRGRRRRRGDSHAGGACLTDMTGGGGGLRPQPRRPTCVHWLSSPWPHREREVVSGEERGGRAHRGGGGRADAAASPRPCAPCTVTMVAGIERGRERERRGGGRRGRGETTSVS